MAKKVNGKSKKSPAGKSSSVASKTAHAKSAGKSKASSVSAAKPSKKVAKISAKTVAVKSAPVKAAVVKVAPAKSVSVKTSAVKEPVKTVAAPVKTVKPVATPTPAENAKPVILQSATDARLEAQYGPGLTYEILSKVKTGLSRKDIEDYRKILMEKRAEILGDVASLEIDARNKNSGGNLSNMPVHMADIGTDNFQQEFTLGLVQSERKLLEEINDALLRIQKGIYGVCLETGKPIGKARLDAKPYARYCIEVARERERRGGIRR